MLPLQKFGLGHLGFNLAFLLSLGLLSLAGPRLAADENSPPAATPRPTAAEASPKTKAEVPVVYTPEQTALKTYIEALFDASRNVNGPQKKDARAKIASGVDWDRIARSCLGDARWKKQSASNRSSFQKLLREVIELTAYSRMDAFWKNAVYKFEKIEPRKNEALLQTRFKTEGENFVLGYYVGKVGSDWRIYDIAFNRERYSVNIQEKIGEFLKEKSFTDLLSALRKRKEELEENTSPATPPSKKAG